MQLLILFFVLSGPAVIRACDKEIVKSILATKDMLIKEDVLHYIQGKTFIDVFAGGNYWNYPYIRENIFCTYAKGDAEEHKITYVKKKSSRVTEVNLYRKYVKKHREIHDESGPFTLTTDPTGAILERNSKNKLKHFVYPIYLNKEAGVYAFHRCSNNLEDRLVPVINYWRTVITVDSNKFGDPPMHLLDPNTWSEVEKAADKINKIEKILNTEHLKSFDDPYSCVFDKKWPELGARFKTGKEEKGKEKDKDVKTEGTGKKKDKDEKTEGTGRKEGEGREEKEREQEIEIEKAEEVDNELKKWEA